MASGVVWHVVMCTRTSNVLLTENPLKYPPNSNIPLQEGDVCVYYQDFDSKTPTQSPQDNQRVSDKAARVKTSGADLSRVLQTGKKKKKIRKKRI